MSLFRRGPDRAEALEAVQAAGSVVEMLKLTRTRVNSVEPVLREAEEEALRGSTVRAVELAERAERIATTLEADHRAAAEGVERLAKLVDRMQELGLPHADEDKALNEVRDRSKSTRDLEGIAVPDYAGAVAIARTAETRAQEKVARSESLADVLFGAELVVDGASESQGGSPESIGEARALLAKARQEVAEEHYEAAASDAIAAERLALAIMDRRRRALETLESVEKIVVNLRTAGVVVGPLRKSLDIGKTLLERGKLPEAVEVFNEAAQEAVSLGTRYRESLNAMGAAKAAIEALRAEGLSSTEAEFALSRASAALKQGNYALAMACCEDVQLAAVNQRKLREGLRALIAETRAKVTMLRDSGLAFVNDAEEMVLKAEREFANGEYEATNEDIRIATLLLGGSAPNGKPKAGSASP